MIREFCEVCGNELTEQQQRTHQVRVFIMSQLWKADGGPLKRDEVIKEMEKEFSEYTSYSALFSHHCTKLKLLDFIYYYKNEISLLEKGIEYLQKTGYDISRILERLKEKENGDEPTWIDDKDDSDDKR